MDDRELTTRVYAGLPQIIKFFGGASRGARFVSWPGVSAAIVPSTPERSLFNSSQFESFSVLSKNYAELEAAYREAGVRAFTVWVNPNDTQQVDFLSAHGHKLDGRPAIMAADASELTLDDAGDLQWSRTRDVEELAAINEPAYGFATPAWSAALTQWVDERAHAYVATLHGKPSALVIALDGDFGDCVIADVATLPEARQQGLASRLLSQALRDAQARGAVTTSLQASSKGRAAYARLGYRDLGIVELWERRS